MQSIKEIQIQNFQSHQSSSLQLSSGLNIITGPSDTGKSAIIRALRWVLYNEPLGDDFIRVGTSECRVAILLENGYRIIRERSSKENRYVLIDAEGREEVFAGFGTKVPQEISEVHQMAKVVLDDEIVRALNLDYQLSGPFLLSDTGSTKAKAVGQLTGVHIIDAAIQDLARDIGRNKGQKKQELAEIERIEERLESYQDLEQLEVEIESQQQLLTKIKEMNTRLEKLKSLTDNLRKLEEEEKNLKQLLTALADIEKLELIYQQALAQQRTRTKLTRLNQNWEQTEQAIKHSEQLLKSLEGLTQAQEYSQRLQESWELKNKLWDLKQQLDNVESAQVQNNQLLKRTSKLDKLEELLEENFPLKQAEYEQLESYYSQWNNLKNKLEISQKLLAKLPKVEEGQNLINNLEDLAQELVQLKDLKNKYQSNQQSLEEGRKWIAEVEAQLSLELKEYEAELRQANQCPVCFSAIDDSILENIIAEYQLGGLEDE